MTMATHYDITMKLLGMTIVTLQNVIIYIHCDVIMSNGIAMCTYYGITMHIDVAMNLFYYVFLALCLYVLFYYE